MADPSEAPLIPEGETTSDVELSAVATGSPEPEPTLDSAPTDAETSAPVVAETPPTKTQAPAPLPPATSSQTTSVAAPSGGQTKPPPQTTASQTKPSPQTTGSQAAAAAAPPHPPPSGASILHAPLTGQEGPHEKKAREFVEQADKKIKSAQSFFGGLFGGSATKLEDAADLYIRAANSYKVAKKPKAAGAAFCRAADLHLQLETKHEAATNLSDAGQVLKKEDPNEAAKCYHHAIEIYTDMGRFSLAARYLSTVAEIYETEILDFEQAISNYEQSADFFKGEDSVGSANKCLVKVAHMCAQLQQFEKATSIFEDIGRNSLENTLLKYAAKDYFFKAAVCSFCQGPDIAREAIERYRSIHPGFDGSREMKFVLDLLAAFDDEDSDKFADIVKDYDSISRIDQWLTTQLLLIKKKISEVDIN